MGPVLPRRRDSRRLIQDPRPNNTQTAIKLALVPYANMCSLRQSITDVYYSVEDIALDSRVCRINCICPRIPLFPSNSTEQLSQITNYSTPPMACHPLGGPSMYLADLHANLATDKFTEGEVGSRPWTRSIARCRLSYMCTCNDSETRTRG